MEGQIPNQPLDKEEHQQPQAQVPPQQIQPSLKSAQEALASTQQQQNALIQQQQQIN